MYFDRNISENKDGKKNEGSYLSCVANGEFYFKPSHYNTVQETEKSKLLIINT